MTIIENIAVPERSAAEYECDFSGANEAEDVLLPASIISIAVTLRDVLSGTVIRNAQNVLNANGGTLDVSGKFKLQLDPADHVIFDTTTHRTLHQRKMTLRVTYARTGGVSNGELNEEVLYYVEALQDVS